MSRFATIGFNGMLRDDDDVKDLGGSTMIPN